MAQPPSRRGEGTSERRTAIEASVLQATEELLGEGLSFSDLNIERIATRAGISRTAFYFYFRDRRELLMRLTEDVSELLYRRAEVWWQGEGVQPEALREALSGIAGLYLEHGALLRAIVEVSTYDEEIAVHWRGLVGRFVEATRERIMREQQAGRAQPGLDAQAVAFSLVWMVERTLYEHLVQEGPVTRETVVEALLGIWQRAVFTAA